MQHNVKGSSAKLLVVNKLSMLCLKKFFKNRKTWAGTKVTWMAKEKERVKFVSSFKSYLVRALQVKGVLTLFSSPSWAQVQIPGKQCVME